MSQQGDSCYCCGRPIESSLGGLSLDLDIFDGDICDECYSIIEVAVKALKQARTDGNHYTVDSWRTDTERDNLEHALTHIFKYKRQDTTEDHIAHAICTLVMEYARSK